MPLQATSGAASYDAFGGGVAAVPNYIEDVFSTYLYSGNGSTQTITNGIDVSGEGGLVWVKARANGNRSHTLFDSATYTTGQYYLATNITNGFLDTGVAGTFALNNSGFSVSGTSAQWNASGELFASWTFRKAPKFFDVVTYTGNGAGFGGSNVVNHNLASLPGCVIIKNVSDVSQWFVFTRNSSGTYYQLNLNQTVAGAGPYAATTYELTSTSFNAAKFTDLGSVNTDGNTYVAYLFAHDAGGFGLTGTDNVISCGSFTTDGSGLASISLGYEPQWVLYKRTNAAEDWFVRDNMRGWSKSTNAFLRPNLSDAELISNGNYTSPNATGFEAGPTAGAFSASSTYIYIAIRRGPMKVPTSGTSVFSPNVFTTNNTITTNFPVDLSILKLNKASTSANQFYDRLRGAYQQIFSNSTAAEATNGASPLFDNNTGTVINGFTAGLDSIGYSLKRAPSFFDEVCYTGTGSATTVAHNLGVAPELMIVKQRSSTTGWVVYSSALAASDYLVLNNTSASQTASTIWNSTAPTASVFSVGTSTTTNTSAGTYVAYLFATCAGVSKCTSFTGTGTLQTINCGFTAGSRFVLIKRTDAAGDWYVWDSSRGLSSSTDPYLLLNSTAAEVTSTNWVDTTATGFQVTAASGNNVNINGASYIALAIA